MDRVEARTCRVNVPRSLEGAGGRIGDRGPLDEARLEIVLALHAGFCPRKDDRFSFRKERLYRFRSRDRPRVAVLPLGRRELPVRCKLIRELIGGKIFQL